MAEVAGQMRVNEDGGNGKMKVLGTASTGLMQANFPNPDVDGLMMVDSVATAGHMLWQFNLG